MVGKWKAVGNYSWVFGVTSTGLLNFAWSANGTAFTAKSSTVAVGFTAGAVGYIGFDFDVDNGASGNTITFFTSADGVTWTQLGAAVVTAGVTSIYDSIAVVEIGAIGNGTSENWAGKIYQAQIYNGINGTLAVDFNASRYSGGGTTLTGSTGETWTLNGSAYIPVSNYPIVGYVPWEARTNTALQSQTLATTWSVGAGLAAVSSDQYVAPDGSTTVDKLVCSAGNTQHFLQLNGVVSISTGATTYSFYLRYVNHRWASVGMNDGTNVPFGSFDLLNGAVGTTTASTTSTIEPTAFSGVYRCTITRTMTANAGGSIYVAMNTSDSASAQTWNAVGTEAIGAWGAMVNLGAFAGPYVPTTTVAVARNADVLTYTGADVANIKTLACTFSRGVGVSSNGYGLTLGDGTVSNYSAITFPSGTESRFLGVTGGATQWSVEPSYTAGTVTKMSVSFATNDVKMDKDGTAQTQDTAATMPTINQLAVGHVTNTFVLNGPVNHIYGWTRNLSQSELGAIDRA
jgi:hypothetical protein